MQVLTASQASPEVPINENFETLQHQQVYGKKHPTTTGLTWGYYGGRWGGFSVSDGTLALTGSTTNYIVVLRSSGAISVSTTATNWNDATNYARVYKIATGASSVTTVEDHRVGDNGVHGGGVTSISLDDLSDVDLSSSPVPADGDVLTWDTSLSPPAARFQAPVGGGGGSTTGRHSIPIMAAGMSPSASGGCAALATTASASNQPDLVTLDFDATTEEYAQFAIPMPKKWDEGTITAKFIWSHAATTTNFGVVWGLQAVAVSDDDTIAAAYGTAQTATDTGGTTNDLYVSPETSAITVAGTPAAEDVVFFRVSRKAADGSDTLAIDARLHSVVLYITTAADTDA